MNRWKDALPFVAIAIATGCAMRSEAGADAIQGDDTLQPAGFVLEGETVPDKNHRAECLNAILTDVRLMCIYQGLGAGGTQTLESQQTAASGCGCTAEAVVSDVTGANGQQRVAFYCPGDPEFSGVFNPPPGPTTEPPFIGIHINPDGPNSSMCDVTLGDTGFSPRQKNENCSSCHGQNLTPKWSPAVDSPALPPDMPIEQP